MLARNAASIRRDAGVVSAFQGDRCDSDGAKDLFGVGEAVADKDINVLSLIRNKLAVDLAARMAKAVGSPHNLRVAIRISALASTSSRRSLKKHFPPASETELGISD